MVDVRSYTEMEVLGGTRMMRRGVLDKVARVLGIGYPAAVPWTALRTGR